jgi:hypothetical protein
MELTTTAYFITHYYSVKSHWKKGDQLTEHLLRSKTPVIRVVYCRHAVYCRQNLHTRLRPDSLMIFQILLIYLFASCLGQTIKEDFGSNLVSFMYLGYWKLLQSQYNDPHIGIIILAKKMTLITKTVFYDKHYLTVYFCSQNKWSENTNSS